MAAQAGDFNPFVDDDDSVEDSTISDREDYTARPVAEEYLAADHPMPTIDELEDELPPATEYDFEAELQLIIDDMARGDTPLPGLSTFKPIDEPVESSGPLEEDVPQSLASAPLESSAPLSDSFADEPADASDEESLEDLLGPIESADEEVPSLSPELEELFPTLSESYLSEVAASEAPAAEPVADPAEASTEDPLEEFFKDLDADEDLEPDEVEEDDEEIEFLFEDEDDFVPPADPFSVPEEDATPATPSEAIEEAPEPEVQTDGDEPANDEPADEAVEPEIAPEKKNRKLKKPRIDFSKILADIKSELKGGDEVNGTPASSMGSGKSASPPRNVLNPDEESTDEVKSGNKLSALFSTLGKPYGKVVDLFVKILSFALGILSKLPVVGKFFSAAAGSKFLRKVAAFLPIICLLAFLSWHGNGKYGPAATEAAYADGGSATFKDFAWVKSESSAAGTITNNGDVIAAVKPTFTVYSIQPSLNPLSLFYPKKAGTCQAKEVKVEIEQSQEVKVPCDANIGGFRKKVSGKLEW